MMKQRPRPVTPSLVEKVDFKLLHVVQATRVLRKLRKVIGDVDVLYFLFEQICFVEEENYRDAGEGFVINDCFEYVARLHQSVGFAIFVQKLIEFARRDEEQYGRHLLETLIPFLSLRSLTPDVDEPKWNIFDKELMLAYALRGFARMQNVQLGWYVILQNNHVKRWCKFLTEKMHFIPNRSNSMLGSLAYNHRNQNTASLLHNYSQLDQLLIEHQYYYEHDNITLQIMWQILMG